MATYSEVTPDANQKYSDLLPRWTYQSSAFYDLEVEHLFKRNWLLAGHINDFKNPGDYLTFEAFNERVLIVADRNNIISAFHNVCRHRGGRVVKDSQGNCRNTITCPFHGWCYGLDGKLVHVPAEDTFTDLDKSQHSLATVDLEIWMGFVFIRLISGGPSLQSQLAPVAEEVSMYLPEQLQPLETSVDVKPYNWKCIHDIDNEGYHVPVGHPSLEQLYGGNYLDTIENNIMVARATINNKPAKNWSVKHYQQHLPDFDHLPQDRQKVWFYFMTFPNLIFGFYPDMMEIYMTIPDSADSTRYISRTFALPDSRREARVARYLNTRINAETADEDDKFVSWLQEGMKSSAWREPQLSSLEEGVRFFHHQIQSVIPVGRLRKAPAEQEIATSHATTKSS